MSRKTDKKKATKVVHGQILLRLGNFLIKRYSDDIFTYIRITTAAGEWRMDFREDSLKYSWILMLAGDEKLHEVLRAWIVVCYHGAMCNPDVEFLEAQLLEFDNLGQRAMQFQQQDDVANP